MKYTFFLLVLIGQCSCRDKEVLKTGFEGKPIPAFNLLSADNATFFRSSNVLNNKSSIVFFLTSTCPYCQAQMKKIIKNIDSFNDSYIYLVTNSAADIKSFEERYDLNQYRNIIVGMDSGYVLQDYYKVSAVPYLAVVNKEGKLTQAFKGITSIKDLTGALRH